MGAALATETWLDAHDDHLVELTRALVRLPSENRPPHGAEAGCQRFVTEFLRGLGVEPDVFRPDEVDGILDHPGWWPGRDYADRPNVVARVGGRGGGRSLLFTGHVDVVPAVGAGRHSHYGAELEDGRLYGRGAFDMKGGVACYLHALRCLCECGVALDGDLLIETVVDEEFGGANGTLACRLRGFEADGAVLPEPTGLAVCPSTRGGIQYRLRADGGSGGMQYSGEMARSALVALSRIAVALDAAQRRRSAPIVQMLLRAGEELPWGTGEGLPADGVLEFWCEVAPGTSRAEVEAELRGIVSEAATPGIEISWEQRTRFLAATSIPADAPIVTAMVGALAAGGRAVGVEMAPFACDAFVLNDWSSTPVVVCGPGGGNAHAPDEFVLAADLLALARAYVRLALDWCGASP
jgi:acetylornithine deacetylase